MKRYVPGIVFGCLGVLLVAVWPRSPAPAPAAAAPVVTQSPAEPAPKQLPAYDVPVAAPVRQPVTTQPYMQALRSTDEPRLIVPETVAQQPLSVNIYGPTKQALEDGPLRFSAVLTGKPASIKWRVRKIDVEVPTDSRGLTITDNGMNVSFSGPTGFYIVGVAVAGTDNAVDWYWHDFEITSEAVAKLPPEEPAAPNHSESGMAGPPQPPQENLQSYVARLVNSSVQSSTRAADAVSVGGCFRSVANQIQTGQYSGSDPMTDVRRQAQLALNNTAASWEPFFAGIDALLAHLRQRGLASTTENVGAILGEVGNVLASAR